MNQPVFKRMYAAMPEFAKALAKKAFERVTGRHILRELPRGFDFSHDIAGALPHYSIATVFDVGANVGQVARVYLTRFPHADIYCFEPVAETFRQLQSAIGDGTRTHCYHLALGSSKRKGTMVLQGPSDQFFLMDESREADNVVATESTDVITLDAFCVEHDILRINFLKIDTEGADLDVLKGATFMLSEQRIDFVEVEAGMNSNNTLHVPFEVLKAFLESHEYYLFGIYEQFEEWPQKEPHLRRTNPVFMSSTMIEESKKSAMS